MLDPDEIGRYRVTSLLGTGGMGRVFRAYDPQLERSVAIKLLHETRANADARMKLAREARIMAQVDHPNIVGVYDIGDHQGQIYLAMELVVGQALDDWLKLGPHPWRRVVSVFADIGRGLATAHGRGVVHRDFKPANAILGADGRARVLDFGLARLRDQLGDERSWASGTPAYMAPEQHAGGGVGPQSDQYAFCASLYEALNGVRPFGGSFTAVLERAKREMRLRPARPGYRPPASVARLVARGLCPTPRDRHRDMSQLVAELDDRIDPRHGRTRRATLALGSSFALVGLCAMQLAQSPKACQAAASPAHRLWTPMRSERTREAFVATGHPRAIAQHRHGDQRLRAYLAAWRSQARDVCEAGQTGLLRNTGRVDLRQQCLRSRLAELEVSVDGWAHATRSTLDDMVDAIPDRDSLADCEDGERWRREGSLPDDPARRRRALADRAALHRSRTDYHAGRRERAGELALPLTDSELADVRSEAHGLLARIAAGQFASQRARDHVFASLEAARASGDDQLAVDSSVGAVWILGYLLRDTDSLPTAMRSAQADIDRLEDSTAALVRLWGHAGAAYGRVGDTDRALVHFRAAHDLVAREWGPESSELGDIAGDLGVTYKFAGDLASARIYLERAVTIERARFAADDPVRLTSLTNLADTLRTAGQIDAALEHLQEVEDIIVANRVDDAFRNLMLWSTRGLAHEAVGRLQQAREDWMRALAIHRSFAAAGELTGLIPLNALIRLSTRLGDLEPAAPWIAAQSPLLAQAQRTRGFGIHLKIGLRARIEWLVARGQLEPARAAAEILRAQISGSIDDASPSVRHALAVLAAAESGCARGLELLPTTTADPNFPYDAPGWARARLLEDCGQPERAADTYAIMIAAARDQPAAREPYLAQLKLLAESATSTPRAAFESRLQTIERRHWHPHDWQRLQDRLVRSP